MAKFKRVSIDSLRPGFVLRAPISDPDSPQVKLLAEGTEVSEAFLEKLRQRGIQEVVLGERDLAITQAFQPQGRSTRVVPPHEYLQSICVNDQTKAIDRLVHEGAQLKLGEITEPLAAKLDPPSEGSYREDLSQNWAVECDEQVETLSKFFDACHESGKSTIEPLRQLCEQILARIKEDSDAAVCMAGSPYPAQYPARHAVHLAGMAIAIGVQMGLDHAHLIDLGVGCLIHDAGMHQVGLEQFDTESTITLKQLRDLADHPVHSVEIAGRMTDEIPHSSKMVAYQIHERLDGSGYPRGRTSNQIHELAKIAAVADAFTALVTPRPHRLGVQGYHAIKEILEETKGGKFDPNVVRALLRATSLYPIGSYVELSNQRIGRVVRSGGSQYDKPTIEMWTSNETDSPPAVVNLQKESSIQIVRSIPHPKAA